MEGYIRHILNGDIIMENKEFKKTLASCLSKYGFLWKNKHFYFCTDNSIIVINTQKSNYNNCYYINFGFCERAIHNSNILPALLECDVRGRFLYKNANIIKDQYPLNEISVEELCLSINSNMQCIILPVVNEGIRKYFEMFPKAVYAATMKLKQHLNLI